MFVVVEGPEGAGKSTLARGLAARFRAEGRAVLSVRQPGGTPVAEAARKIALKSRHELSPVTELFLFLAARADLVERVIRPALVAGEVVLVDRFDLSTRAYQVAGRGLPKDLVDAAIQLATGGLTADLTIVLDVPVDVGRERQRKAGKAQDRFEREADGFHERVRAAYRAASGQSIIHVDATQHRKAVLDAAWRAIHATAALSTRGIP